MSELIKIDISKLQELQPILDQREGDWSVVSPHRVPLASGLTREGAVLMSCGPALLKFLSGFLRRTNSPPRAQIDMLLSQLGIELVGEGIVGQKQTDGGGE
jgi:hypothetical protein